MDVDVNVDVEVYDLRGGGEAACLLGMLAPARIERLLFWSADAVNGSSKGSSAGTKRFEQFHRQSRGCSQSQRDAPWIRSCHLFA